MSDKGLGHGYVYAIHTHVITIVCGPSQCQFAQVTCTYHQAIGLIGYIHEKLCSLTSLTVFIGDIMLLRIMSQVFEMLYTCILDGNLSDGNAQLLHQVHGIRISAVGGAEARHRHTHDSFPAHPQVVKGTYTNQQGQSAVQTATDAHYSTLCSCVYHSLGKTHCLDSEDIFTSVCQPFASGNKWFGQDFPGEHCITCVYYICIHQQHLLVLILSSTRSECGIHPSFRPYSLHVDLAFQQLRSKGVSVGFSYQTSILIYESLSGKDHILSTFAKSASTEDISADESRTLLCHKAHQIGVLAHQFVISTHVEDNICSVQCK